MRLLRLDLRAIGPFTNLTLDLSGGREGLHLIYGPNEAGKSSTLRALSNLLFGFDHQTPDAFTHEYPQLRVGGRIRSHAGEEFDLVRRKARKDALRAGDDSTVLEPAVLEGCLGGLDRSQFETAFGIDHARLVQGGEELRSGGGRFGESLFAAAAGLGGLREAQRTLQGRLDQLYKPRGQNPRINRELAQFKEAQTTLRDVQVPGERWEESDTALRDAIARSDRLALERRDQATELERLQRFAAAVPLVARRQALRVTLEALEAGPRLRAGFAAEVRQAIIHLRETEQALDKATRRVAEQEKRLAGITPPSAVLPLAPAIEDLAAELKSFQKAREELVALETTRDAHRASALQALRDLGRDSETDSSTLPPVEARETAAIHDLGQHAAEFRTAADKAREEVDRLERVLSDLERQAAELADPPDVSGLARALASARKIGDLDDQLAKADKEAQKLERKVERDIRQLPGWSGGLDVLESLAVPLDATIDQLDSDTVTAATACKLAQDRHETEIETLRGIERDLAALDAAQQVPTEADLHAARLQRDQVWTQIRHLLAATPTTAEASLAADDTAQPLEQAYERAVAHADELADRLRREAERVARKAELVVRRATTTTRVAELRAAVDAQTAVRDAADAAWQRQVQDLHLAPCSPRELRAWLRKREEILRQGELAHEARARRDELARSLADHRATLRPFLTAVPADTAPLAEWLAAGDDLVAAATTLARRRDELDRDQRKALADLETRRREEATARQELTAWSDRWTPHMRRLGLRPEASLAEAEAVLTALRTLHQANRLAVDATGQIQAHEDRCRAYLDRLAPLAQTLLSDHAAAAPGEQVRALETLLKDARALETRRGTIAEQLETDRGELSRAASDQDDARASLERLEAESGCTGAEALQALADQCDERARRRTDLETCEQQLCEHAAGLALDAFTAQVEACPRDELLPRQDECKRRIEDLDAEIRAASESIGRLRAELNRMDGSDAAACASEASQAILARLQDDVEQYALWRLAASVLERGIERYRQKHEGPVLEQASHLFRRLTCGSFSSLRIDEDDQGRSILRGIRPDGAALGPEAMSDGSHDQLYLALRLASLGEWLRAHAHEPIPFVVDDILLNFDDDRAAAALGVLGELAESTQVLLFTHHRHLVEIARRALPPEILFVQELAARPATPPGRPGLGESPAF